MNAFYMAFHNYRNPVFQRHNLALILREVSKWNDC